MTGLDPDVVAVVGQAAAEVNITVARSPLPTCISNGVPCPGFWQQALSLLAAPLSSQPFYKLYGPDNMALWALCFTPLP